MLYVLVVIIVYGVVSILSAASVAFSDKQPKEKPRYINKSLDESLLRLEETHQLLVSANQIMNKSDTLTSKAKSLSDLIEKYEREHNIQK